MKLCLIFSIITAFLSFRNLVAQNCTEIKRSVDKFDSTIIVSMSVQAPSVELKQKGAIYFVAVAKRITKTDTAFLLYIAQSVEVVPSSQNLKGAYIIFDNNTQLKQSDQQIGVKFIGRNPTLYTELKLNRQEFNLFATNKATDIRLGESTGVFGPQIAHLLKEAANCVLNNR